MVYSFALFVIVFLFNTQTVLAADGTIAMPSILPPGMEAKDPALAKQQGAAAVGVAPALANPKPLQPKQKSLPVRQPKQKFYSLDGARQSGGIKPSTEYLLRSDFSKDKKIKTEKAPAEKISGDKVTSPTPAKKHAEVLSIFTDEEIPEGVAPDSIVVADKKAPSHYRTRHGWPISHRIGQVIEADTDGMKIITSADVLASASGRVELIEDKGSEGWAVTLVHKDGSQSIYAHLAKLVVEVGDSVKRRQVIGSLGSTGDGEEKYLHYSLKKDGAFLNPLEALYIPSRIKKMMQEKK